MEQKVDRKAAVAELYQFDAAVAPTTETTETAATAVTAAATADSVQRFVHANAGCPEEEEV